MTGCHDHPFVLTVQNEFGSEEPIEYFDKWHDGRLHQFDIWHDIRQPDSLIFIICILVFSCCLEPLAVKISPNSLLEVLLVVKHSHILR